MSKMFLIASAVLLLISAGLGFVNKGKIAAKQADLDQTHAIAKTAQSDATTAKTKQKAAEKAASEAAAKSTDLQTQLTAATTEVTTVKGQVETATKNIEDQVAQIAQLKKTISDFNNNNGGPKPTEGAPDARIAEMQIQLTELKTVKDQLDSQLKSAQSQTAALQKKINDRASGASMVGLQGRVLAVNHDWNFVVLSLGNRNGVNTNATMIVQRGGNTVGKIRITAVEPSQSIADIVPNSVPPGVIVQPGDNVVFQGL